MVLHTLRCIGFAVLSRVAEATGMDESDVESELIDLAVAGLVTRTTGEFGGGWGQTDAGRAADRERILGELEASGARNQITKSFNDFLVLNPELLDLCSAWQTKPDGTLNDHTDPAYDAKIVGLFADFHRRADPICTALANALPRFHRYRYRLQVALSKAEAGEHRYLTDDFAAYHTVWFQLHEDLLATLDIPRH
jgi:hypothetical protein